MLRLVNFLFFIFSFFYSNCIFSLESNWSGAEEAKVRIISPFSKAGDTSNLYLGLEYKLQNGWKTYWHSPGDGGFPQTIDWKNSIISKWNKKDVKKKIKLK